MTARLRLFAVLLLALAIVAAGASYTRASHQAPERPSASCYYTWIISPYFWPERVLICGTGNGGGSW